MALTGVGLRAALVPSWVVGILLLWMVFRLGQQLWGREAAWLATLLEDNEGALFGDCTTCAPCPKLSQRISRCGLMGDRLSGPETRRLCWLFEPRGDEE